MHGGRASSCLPQAETRLFFSVTLAFVANAKRNKKDCLRRGKVNFSCLESVDNPSIHSLPHLGRLGYLGCLDTVHRLYRVMAGYSISDGTQFEGSPFPKSNTRVIHMRSLGCASQKVDFFPLLFFQFSNLPTFFFCN
jgi:hypothetical protein